MGDNSKIEWTDHTFNPWRGCTKVSSGCANCYADTLSKRNPSVLGVWGPNGNRVRAADAYWKLPLKWNKEAMAAGVRKRVFCASLADVFETWQGAVVNANGKQLCRCAFCDKQFESRWKRILKASGKDYPLLCECGAVGVAPLSLDDLRRELFKLIDATPWLEWLLLTKRPENITQMWPRGGFRGELMKRRNVWLGCSVENQKNADRRIPELLKCRNLASVLFLSCEPLLGSVDLSEYFGRSDTAIDDLEPSQAYCQLCGSEWDENDLEYRCPCGINWVIAGGESGHGARACHLDWVRGLLRQCQSAAVPCFVKQLGANVVAQFDDNHGEVTGQVHLNDKKGANWSELEELDLNVREFPQLVSA